MCPIWVLCECAYMSLPICDQYAWVLYECAYMSLPICDQYAWVLYQCAYMSLPICDQFAWVIYGWAPMGVPIYIPRVLIWACYIGPIWVLNGHAHMGPIWACSFIWAFLYTYYMCQYGPAIWVPFGSYMGVRIWACLYGITLATSLVLRHCAIHGSLLGSVNIWQCLRYSNITI